MSFRSAIFRGKVVHRRHRPRKHALDYRVFSLLIDLDELPLLARQLKLFAHNRFSLFSVHDRDHGALDDGDLKAWALSELEKAGRRASRVEMLCYPRILGYVFNPLTVYFCYREDGRLTAILYEVCNTFRERFTYIIPVDDEDRPVRQTADKQLYVSPFIPMECTYHFTIRPPEENVTISINETDADGALLFASFSGRREALSDRALARAFFSYPLMTVKIIAGIHFEALKMILKGMPVFRHRPSESRIQSAVADGATGDENYHEQASS
ncbi:DUF1365 domain-containing protein [Martelella soudanensis]|uniref:DUF1365 domain-containing protein n=1 Tax=unclassified Martelella TaxID=2629616 RepID=UPI0015DFE76F|nr:MULTISPECIES: DUF1365 domain-containing protein [unclassified Martelella]